MSLEKWAENGWLKTAEPDDADKEILCRHTNTDT